MANRRPHRITGPGASSLKYDILTALLVAAAHADAATGRLAIRLSLLITARFNWRQGTFAVGQREIARMWGVSERTAKREIAELRARSWIRIDVPAARGRVAAYTVEFDQLMRVTEPYWTAVGPDFVARLSKTPEQPASNVIPLHASADQPIDDGTFWSKACRVLHKENPAIYQAWIAPLTFVDTETGVLTLMAETRFAATYVDTNLSDRILRAIPLSEGVHEVRITGPIG